MEQTDDGDTLDEHWFRLRELIYSHEDQCLDIVDPIEMCLDHIQGNIEESNREITYFLQRLPKNDLEESKSFLRNSFGLTATPFYSGRFIKKV